MKKKIVRFAVAVLVLACAMFAEYRIIMHNIVPYIGENGAVYLEVFGQIDEYDAEIMED